MIGRRVAECCKVAGTGWNGAGSPEKFISRARLYVVPDALRCDDVRIAMATHHLPRQGHRPQGRGAARWRPPPTARPHGCATTGLSAATTSPTKRGVVHSEVMLPEDAPEQWGDRERLLNDVEAFEVRKDAQLAREVEPASPREMTQAQWNRTRPRLRAVGICRSGHDRRPQCALGHGRGRDAQAPRPCHAHHAIRGRKRLRPKGAGLEPDRDGRALARTLGRGGQRAAGRTRHRRAHRPSQPESAGHRAGAAKPDRRPAQRGIEGEGSRPP